MDPTLRQLKAFVLTYHHRNLTRAASDMFITQSAVSVLIRQLEDGLGVRLFERTSRSLRATAAAEDMLPTAERMLRDLEQIKGSARTLAERERGHLAFASTPAVAAALLPELIAEYQRRYPGIAVRMIDVPPDQLTAPVLNDDVEFCIGTVGRKAEGVELTCLLRDQLSAICRTDSEIAQMQTVTWRDLQAVPCITVARGNGIRELIDDSLARAGERLLPAYEFVFLTTALAMASAGLGVAVLPSFLLGSLQYKQLVARPLEQPVVERAIHLITRPGHVLSPAATGFLELWKARFGNIDGAQPRR